MKNWKYFKYTSLYSNKIYLYRYTDIKNNMYVNLEIYNKNINKWNRSVGRSSVKSINGAQYMPITKLEMFELL